MLKSRSYGTNDLRVVRIINEILGFQTTD